MVIKEPIGRNTAPAILYSCLEISKLEKDAVIVFLPADSFVVEEDKYRTYLKTAIEYASKTEKIVTLGVMPTKPATGYGYIQAECDTTHNIDCGKPYNVFKFHEKPDLSLAQGYIKQHDMFWNISVFVGKVSVFLKEFKEHAPDIFDEVQNIVNLGHGYEKIKNISVDYALMEKSKNVVVLPCDFEWSDVGNLDVFLSLQEKLYKNTDFKVININSKNNLVQLSNQVSNKKKIVAFLGIENVCLIEDEDVILVAKRDEVEKVKKVLVKLKEESLEEFL